MMTTNGVKWEWDGYCQGKILKELKPVIIYWRLFGEQAEICLYEHKFMMEIYLKDTDESHGIQGLE